MGLVLTSAPAAEPITITEAKLHARVDASTEDDLFTSLIKAARIEAEVYTQRAFVTQTWRLSLDAFPTGKIRLPFPPLVSIGSISYVDSNGVTQTLDAANYEADATATPGYVVPAYGLFWPTARYKPNSVLVTFTAGYGAAAAVPESLKDGIKMRVAEWFENREGDKGKIPPAVEALYQTERWGGFQ